MPSSTLSVKWQGKEALKDALDEILKKLDAEGEKLAQSTLSEMKSASPVKTGRLRASNMMEGEGWDFSLENHVMRKKGVEYSGFQEFSTRKNRAHPFLEPAIGYWEESVESSFDKAFDGF